VHHDDAHRLGANGVAEQITAAAVAKKVLAATSTSLPSTPMARSGISMALVPEFTVTAWSTPRYAAKRSSSWRPSLPKVSWPVARHSSICWRMAALSSGGKYTEAGGTRIVMVWEPAPT